VCFPTVLLCLLFVDTVSIRQKFLFSFSCAYVRTYVFLVWYINTVVRYVWTALKNNLSTPPRNEVVPLWPIMTQILTIQIGKIRATDEELNRYHLFLEAIIAQAQSVENHR